MMTPQEFEDLKKTYPKGWSLRKEFEDALGNYYVKGKLVREAGVIPPVDQVPIIKQEQTKVEEKKAPQPTQAPQQNDMLSVFKMFLEEMNKRNSNAQTEKVPFGHYSAIQRPADDYMDKEKTYIVVGKGYPLSDYIKNGQVVLAPFNMPIYFTREWDEQSGEKGRVISFSIYRTHSKAESDFIENSPYFGTIIHTTKEGAESIDTATMDKMETAILAVQRMDSNSVIAKATSLGININQNEDKIRSAITKVIVENEIGREKQQLENRLTEMQISFDQFQHSKNQ